MTPEVYEWARRWSIPPQAVNELVAAILPPSIYSLAPDDASESRAQSEVRLEAAAKGVRLWRNNVGALQDETGRFVRYGLANDNEKLNKRLKSSDLIGWRRVTITPAMVGRVIAQFVGREIKPRDWRYSGTPREEAQARWAELVTVEGGDACFATGPGTL